MSIDTNAIAKMGVKGESSWLISDMRQINLFIGPNNSGKSRFIRSMFLYYSKGFCFDLRNVSIKEISEHVKKKIFVNNHSMPLRSLDVSVSGKLEQSITIEGSKVHDLSSFISAIYRASTRNGNTSITAENNFDQVIKSSYLDDIVDGETIKFIENLKQVDWRLVYIPTLRTLRSVAESDVFHKRTTSDYFKDLKDKNASIFTGHELYKDLVRHLLGTHEKRLKVRSYETYLSEHFFFGKEISLVPMVDQDVVYLKEAEKPDRPIYDLGDGIQSIILVTYKVFMAEQPTMFFIEEPEHHLHAGLQRTLIETIAKNKEHLFFITTHSNHFLDLAQERDDVSVQKIWKNGDETLVEPVEKFTMLLTELGVRASSVLLANCSIWVEGVTDKLYLRTYLKKYIDELQEKDPQQAQRLKSYHENLHFVFAQYQGSNITHWDFNDDVIRSEDKTQAKCFSRNIFLVADADIKNKSDRVAMLDKQLGNDFHLLEWKEIENYIPFDILIKVAEKRWDTFNQKAGCSIERFSDISEDEFKSEISGVGMILERYVDKTDDLPRKFFEDNSGTIKDKVKFCQTAISIMSQSDDWRLTPELNILCKKIWEHIIQNN